MREIKRSKLENLENKLYFFIPSLGTAVPRLGITVP